MDFYQEAKATGTGGGDTVGLWRRSRGKVLLREPEVCPVCTKVYISLYPLRHCADHDGLDEL